MGLFTLGTDLAMTPIGQHVGSAITRSRKLWFIALIGFVVGILITLSEPDLQVLAEQVPGVPNMVLMVAVAIGVGLFLVVALLRIILAVKMWYLLLGCYVLVFVLALFVPRSFLAVAFDSGGVTTGPMTVPFILALGVGVSAMRNDSAAENDSFGLVALCSIGPILAVMVLGLMYRPDEAAYTSSSVIAASTSTELWGQFMSAPAQVSGRGRAGAGAYRGVLLHNAVHVAAYKGRDAVSHNSGSGVYVCGPGAVPAGRERGVHAGGRLFGAGAG